MDSRGGGARQSPDTRHGRARFPSDPCPHRRWDGRAAQLGRQIGRTALVGVCRGRHRASLLPSTPRSRSRWTATSRDGMPRAPATHSRHVGHWSRS